MKVNIIPVHNIKANGGVFSCDTNYCCYVAAVAVHEYNIKCNREVIIYIHQICTNIV